MLLVAQSPYAGVSNFEKHTRTPQDIVRSFERLKPEELENFFKNELPGLIGSLDIAYFNDLIHPYGSVIEHAASIPFTSQELLSESSQSSSLKRFILNITDTFITALNFYDESDPPSSIYEKQVLITIYYRLIQIPFGLTILIQPLVVVAWKAYLIVMAILLAAIALIYAYHKWLRPYPATVPNCTMNKELVGRVYQNEIIGLERETEALISHLNRPKTEPVMVLGATGIGKTTLMHKLQQKIDSGQIPPSLKHKKIVSIDCGLLMAKSSTGIGDKIKRIKYSLSGFEGQTIIHLDEVQPIAQNRAAFDLLKDFIRTSGFQCVVSTTLTAFNSDIIPADIDQSFRRSFGANYIFVDKWDPKHVESLLQQMAASEPGIIFTDEAFKKIVELTDTILPELPQPAKSVEFMKCLIEKYKNLCDFPDSPELKKKKTDLDNLEEKWKRTWPEEKHDDKQLRASLKNEIAEMENGHKVKRTSIDTFATLMNLSQSLKKQTINDAFSLHREVSLQKRYLFNYFYLLPYMKQKSLELARTLGLVVDLDFVLEAFENYKGIKESVHQAK